MPSEESETGIVEIKTWGIRNEDCGNQALSAHIITTNWHPLITSWKLNKWEGFFLDRKERLILLNIPREFSLSKKKRHKSRAANDGNQHLSIVIESMMAIVLATSLFRVYITKCIVEISVVGHPRVLLFYFLSSIIFVYYRNQEVIRFFLSSLSIYYFVFF
jgi:hypothetical protein